MLGIEPYDRLQLQLEHQPVAPTTPGGAGMIYLPGWIKDGKTEGRIYVAVKKNTNRWTFCGIYETQLLDAFKPLLWKDVPEEVRNSLVSIASMVTVSADLVL